MAAKDAKSRTGAERDGVKSTKPTGACSTRRWRAGSVADKVGGKLWIDEALRMG